MTADQRDRSRGFQPAATRHPFFAGLAADRDVWLAAVPAVALVVGVALFLFGVADVARWLFAAATGVVLLSLLRQIVASLTIGEIGLDIIAALAMGGALALGEWLAGAVVALMYAGGQALESRAQARAASEMTALLARAPQTSRILKDGTWIDVAVDQVKPGDRLLVSPGEVVPVDGRVRDGVAVLDEAALTGESLPATYGVADAVESGAQNAGGAFVMEATASAADSAFARIIGLVDAARRSKAPMARLAERYALGFLTVTLLLAGGAWFVSGEATRALAVLVVATPCPLILAVPVAIVAGMSRAATSGVLIKSARAFEALARCRTLLVDKTGTLTHGTATIAGIAPLDGFPAEEALRIAASLAQASHHVLSEALVAAARQRGHVLSQPDRVTETAGAGVVGIVEGRTVAIGRRSFVDGNFARGDGTALETAAEVDGAVELAVAVDGRIVAFVTLSDPVRPDAASSIRRLRDLGFTRVVLVTGDAAAVAARIAAPLAVDAVHADVSPAGKLAIVARETAVAPSLMIGDGINDAAALAGASVGMAMGARGSAAASEAADVVLLVDRFDRVPEAVAIAQRARQIALQSVVVGIALSVVGMVVAAAGHLPPLAGALVQEAIDVAVVINALRALGPGGARR